MARYVYNTTKVILHREVPGTTLQKLSSACSGFVVGGGGGSKANVRGDFF